MNYNFDEIIERKNTDSVKYDFALKRGKPADALPLWVADMDFRAPQVVLDALAEKSCHGVFGYSEAGEDYFNAVKQWFSSRFDWEPRPEWLIKAPGVVYAICAAIRAFTNKGDAVIIQQPVYYPFAESVRKNERKLVVNQLIYSDGHYTVDFADFEHKIIENNVKLFILCSPHNPVGRVWTKEELVTLGDICLRHGVLVISDEIHADFVYPNHKHLVFASIKPEYKAITITYTAPTKTFNLAGLQISNIFISNKEIRRAFRDEMSRSGYSQVGIMGLVACKAAYSNGAEWLNKLQCYLQGNLEFVRGFLEEHLPDVKLVEPEGTYLVWLDFRKLGLTDAELEHLITEKARLWLDAGTMFGKGGEGFQRVNIACPRATLEKAFLQLKSALNDQ